MSIEPTPTGGVPVEAEPVGADIDAPAQTPPSPEKGMFGIQGTGDVSGFGGLVRRRPDLAGTPRPFRNSSTRSRLEWHHTSIGSPTRPVQFQCGNRCNTGLSLHQAW